MGDSPNPATSSVAPASELDCIFERVRNGDMRAFEAWVARVELPLRTSLRRFARGVDIEAVVQEGLLRMWKLAAVLQLEGPDASLRYALRIVRNLALAESRRLKRITPLELEALENLPEAQVDPAPVPDPGLRRLLRACIERLPERPRLALLARLNNAGCAPDRDLAAALRMTTNTFFQNIVRARKQIVGCLEEHGVKLGVES